jgi:hypothetical protein
VHSVVGDTFGVVQQMVGVYVGGRHAVDRGAEGIVALSPDLPSGRLGADPVIDQRDEFGSAAVYSGSRQRVAVPAAMQIREAGRPGEQGLTGFATLGLGERGHQLALIG